MRNSNLLYSGLCRVASYTGIVITRLADSLTRTHHSGLIYMLHSSRYRSRYAIGLVVLRQTIIVAITLMMAFKFNGIDYSRPLSKLIMYARQIVNSKT